MVITVTAGAFSPVFTWFFQRSLSVNDPWVLGTWKTGGTQWWRYIPVSRFWPMQFFESGWLLALSALLVAGTVRLVRRHAA